MEFKVSNDEIISINDVNTPSFPKYTSQLINWANQNAQGTRPKTVGQMSELFPEFQREVDNITIDAWKQWYLEKHPDAMNIATEKIYQQVLNLRDAIPLIDKEMIYRWVEDLLINKTFNGMYFQKVILSKLAEIKGTTYRLSTPDEESIGIDGYVGEQPYSIKPDSYKTMGRLSETIDVKMIYYIKEKNGLIVEVEE